jgi:predicted secreted protein
MVGRSGIARYLGLVGVALLVAPIAACTGPAVVDVPVDRGSARLAVGEVLRVDLGEVNESIGDSWYLVTPPDPAVLDDDGRDYDSECDMAGCGAHVTWDFVAAGPGSTALVFRYCYRSRPADCEAEPSRGPVEPVTLNVVVDPG